MQGEIVSSDQQPPQRPLGDRLDDSIGEASNGIGALLSELVRRSLKAGVSDIGESLAEFAEERVETAVGQQMPGITEAADAVAQSTSTRIVQQAVERLDEQTARQQQVIESKIDAAETNAVDRSRSHLEDALNEVNQCIGQARDLAVEGNDASQRKIEELREKARHTWRRLKQEFSAVNDAHQQLRSEHEKLRPAYEQLRREHDALSKKLDQVCETHRRETDAAEERFAALALQNKQLEERLAFLEQPRGIKGLIAKFRRGGKAEPTDQAVASDESPADPEQTDA